ncbi:hypothetical protein [Paenibacillus dendritiformis]|uniref:hypothetical protein n=1 Tax=Paenibacillus dendritiformis TaxID=130049 RepID=UPI0020C2A09B|nr:hypothetical protein [Paenibacillus dendritiformis]CAH8767566.1 hypothetical protein H7S4_000236 [Paenibacillus dendritiformis]
MSTNFGSIVRCFFVNRADIRIDQKEKQAQIRILTKIAHFFPSVSSLSPPTPVHEKYAMMENVCPGPKLISLPLDMTIEEDSMKRRENNEL